ncbi:MAG: hypothetical protein ACQETP_11355, partial [Bacteroidota bacterium]
FTSPYYGSPVFWVTRGYVVLDDAAFPIIGEGDKEPNDSFREQLVANGKAASTAPAVVAAHPMEVLVAVPVTDP